MTEPPRARSGKGGGPKPPGGRREPAGRRVPAYRGSLQSDAIRTYPQGFAAREVAVHALAAILARGRALDDAFEAAVVGSRTDELETRDRGLALLIVRTVLRRKGELEAVIKSFLERPLPQDCGRLWPILLSAAAQLLILETPPHAAISLAVDQCRNDRGAARFANLANAVLRRVSREGQSVLATLDSASLNVPVWLFSRWSQTYGEVVARQIITHSLAEAPLDLSVKSDAAAWAQTLHGTLLPTGTVRLADAGRVEALTGFDTGAWWVQDAAAALPAKLIGSVQGLEVADLCAAPGGKTAELAAAGAKVTAVDISPARLARVRDNLARLGLSADIVAADIATWAPERDFDAVLLDAPCTATGTIRRHPDIVHLKRDADIAELAKLQAVLLARASTFVRPGGLLIFCTCSLEPEEGVNQIAQFLSCHPDYVREPIHAGESGIDRAWISPDGDLRTLPFHEMDGFFAARLRRKAGSAA